MATKSTQQGNGITPRMVRVAGLPPGSFPGRCCSVGGGCRSDVSVDLAGRTARTPSGRPLLVTATHVAKLHFAEQVTQTMLTVTALSVEPSLN